MKLQGPRINLHPDASNSISSSSESTELGKVTLENYDPQVIKKFLEKNKPSQERINGAILSLANGKTLIRNLALVHMAVIKDDRDSLKIIAEKYPELFDSDTGPWGENAAMLAVILGRQECLEIIANARPQSLLKENWSFRDANSLGDTMPGR